MSARRPPLAGRAADAGEVLVEVVVEGVGQNTIFAADQSDDEEGKRRELTRSLFTANLPYSIVTGRFSCADV